jgi:hypothetical protein
MYNQRNNQMYYQYPIPQYGHFANTTMYMPPPEFYQTQYIQNQQMKNNHLREEHEKEIQTLSQTIKNTIDNSMEKLSQNCFSLLEEKIEIKTNLQGKRITEVNDLIQNSQKILKSRNEKIKKFIKRIKANVLILMDSINKLKEKFEMVVKNQEDLELFFENISKEEQGTKFKILEEEFINIVNIASENSNSLESDLTHDPFLIGDSCEMVKKSLNLGFKEVIDKINIMSQNSKKNNKEEINKNLTDMFILINKMTEKMEKINSSESMIMEKTTFNIIECKNINRQQRENNYYDAFLKKKNKDLSFYY